MVAHGDSFRVMGTDGRSRGLKGRRGAVRRSGRFGHLVARLVRLTAHLHLLSYHSLNYAVIGETNGQV